MERAGAAGLDVKDFGRGDGLAVYITEIPDGERFDVMLLARGIDGDGDGSFDDTVFLAFLEQAGANIFFKAVLLQDLAEPPFG
ncbi:MAG: hypothetical protein U1E14_19140 [Geminicoccaceae bacterium]